MGPRSQREREISRTAAIVGRHIRGKQESLGITGQRLAHLTCADLGLTENSASGVIGDYGRGYFITPSDNATRTKKRITRLAVIYRDLNIKPDDPEIAELRETWPELIGDKWSDVEEYPEAAPKPQEVNPYIDMTLVDKMVF
ncbi:MAG: hypothetical protein ABIJ92_04125 [Candidatus Aenigmatarchaeota archaeon]